MADIRSGATDEFLTKKYGISEKGLQGLFQKLIAAKLLTQTDLDQRVAAVDEVEIIQEGTLTKGKSLDVLKELGEKFNFSKEDVERLKTASLKDIKELMEKYHISLSDAKELLKTLGISTGSLLTQAAGKLKEGTRRLREEIQQRQANGENNQSSESPQEKLKRVGGQAVDKARGLKDRAAEKSVRLLGSLKRIAVYGIVGILGLAVVGLIGYMAYAKWQNKRPVTTYQETGTKQITASSDCEEAKVPFPVKKVPTDVSAKEALAAQIRLRVLLFDLLHEDTGGWQKYDEVHKRIIGEEGRNLSKILKYICEEDYGCKKAFLIPESFVWDLVDKRIREAFPSVASLEEAEVKEKKEWKTKWETASEKEKKDKQREREQKYYEPTGIIEGLDDEAAKYGRKADYAQCVRAAREVMPLLKATIDKAIEERRDYEKKVRDRQLRIEQCQKKRQESK